MTVKRPDPEKLLRNLNAEERGSVRGALKIYIGMAAGVGKTYAMLSDALELQKRGIDVIAGYIEPHDRQETIALANQLEHLPAKTSQVAGRSFSDFDIDGALKRKPKVLLVDELAHTNIADSRHPKRWQDVQELLEAGIDVYTTLNIQHLESLREVVSQITGIFVQETIPDSILAQADEVELVDIPARDLIQRIREGKVYGVDRIESALANFFREGNLIALRELVLRVTADRVDEQMQHYRLLNAVSEIWPTRQRIMVCVGPSPTADALVRAAQRLASSLHAELLAVNLLTAQFLSRSAVDQARATQALEVAARLGAKTVTRPALDMVQELVAIAAEYNVTAFVVGKPIRPRWKELLSRSLVDELLRRAPLLSLHVISMPDATPGPHAVFAADRAHLSWGRSFLTLLILLLTSGVCALASNFLEPSNLSMIYLLAVSWIAYRFTWREAILASTLSIAAFDFFFVPPQLTFSVHDVQYLVTFVGMLAISLLISTLAMRLKAQAKLSSEREARTASLYQVSQSLLSAASVEDIANVVATHAHSLFGCSAFLLTPKADGSLGTALAAQSEWLQQPNELAVARWAFEHRSSAGKTTSTLPGVRGMYLPVGDTNPALAVLAIKPGEDFGVVQLSLLTSFSSQLALALGRLSFESEARKAKDAVESEQLRSTLLSSISHDFRTPLAAIAGASSALVEHETLPSENRKELARTIWDESERLSRIVRNVLDLTRLEDKSIRLRRDWHSLEEIIGSALESTKSLLASHSIIASIPDDFPLIFIDGALVEQVFINLFENAARHTPVHSKIEVSAEYSDDTIKIMVTDDGPGFRPGEAELVFNKLYRGKNAGEQGFGLGLTICSAIIKAHQGTIEAHNTITGAQFCISLPRGGESPKISNEFSETQNTCN